MTWLKKNSIPLLVGIVLALLLWLSIPVNFKAYVITLEGQNTHAKVNQILWADMDGDGMDECVLCGGQEFSTNLKRNGCSMRKNSKSFTPVSIEQANVNELPSSVHVAFDADLNHNQKQELYIAEVINNSIWLNGFEYPEFNTPFVRVELDTFIRYSGECNVYLKFGFQKDIDGDGMDELFFSLRNSYYIYPRKHYRLNINTLELLKSPSTCIDIGYSSIDSTTFENLIYTGSSGASGNYKDSLSIPYSDYFSYAFALDQNLEFVIEPEKLNRYPGGAANILYKGYLYSHITRSINGGRDAIQKRNLDGDVLDSIQLAPRRSKVFLNNNELVYIDKNKIYTVDGNLKLNKEQTFNESISLQYLIKVDLDDDGKDELAYIETGQKELCVISSDYIHLTKFPLDFNCSKELVLAKSNLFNEGTQLVCHDFGEIKYYGYRRNPYYPFKYVYYSGLLFASLGVSLLSFGRYRKGIENRHKQELEMSRLQMLSIKNQVDPHFTLNALNSIDYMYSHEEKEKASSFMVRFSRMMHQTLMNSDKMVCSLYEELDFVRNYCELQKLRLNVPFDCTFKIEDNVDTTDIQIPKQLVFTYIENAIKHGIKPKLGGGWVNIEILRKESNIEISIKDNGIGMKESNRLKTSGTGRGMSIIEEILRLYKKQTGVKINLEISSSGQGTTIQIIVPI